jgi:hypothetical protein
VRRARPVVVLASVAVLAGCSNGGMTPEEYFTELERLSQASDAAFEEWQQDLTDDLQNIGSPEDADEVLRPALEEARGIMQGSLDDVDGLDPPDEAADGHEELVASFRASLDAFDRLLEDYGELGFEGVAAELQGGEFQELDRRQNEACSALQAVADDLGIEVDLSCGA